RGRARTIKVNAGLIEELHDVMGWRREADAAADTVLLQKLFVEGDGDDDADDPAPPVDQRSAAVAAGDVAEEGIGVAPPSNVGEPRRQKLRDRRHYRLHRGARAGIAEHHRTTLEGGLDETVLPRRRPSGRRRPDVVKLDANRVLGRGVEAEQSEIQRR